MGQLGFAVIFILMFLLLAAIVFAVIAELRRRQLQAANRKLREESLERKRVQDEIAQLNADPETRAAARTLKLQAANRELDAFCSSVSHNLCNPALRHQWFYSCSD